MTPEFFANISVLGLPLIRCSKSLCYQYRTSVRGVYACYPRAVQIENPNAHVYETYWEMIYHFCICARSQEGFNMMDIKYGQITFFSTWITLSPMLLDIKLLVMMQLKRGLSALGQRHMLLTQMRMFSRRSRKLKASNAREKKIQSLIWV